MRATQLQLKLAAAQDSHMPSVSAFAKLLAERAPQAQWTELVRDLAMLGVEAPGQCGCTDWPATESWRHKNHGVFNAAVRSAIIAAGAREGMLKAAGFEYSEGTTHPRFTRHQQRDFLSAKPTIEWFKENQ